MTYPTSFFGIHPVDSSHSTNLHPTPPGGVPGSQPGFSGLVSLQQLNELRSELLWKIENQHRQTEESTGQQYLRLAAEVDRYVSTSLAHHQQNMQRETARVEGSFQMLNNTMRTIATAARAEMDAMQADGNYCKGMLRQVLNEIDYLKRESARKDEEIHRLRTMVESHQALLHELSFGGLPPIIED